ncbi:Magnesium chelatase [Methanococcus vannielii SB]|uniref:Magnesium chelatase n=1 Tax=Methanococcus vannielii (strain ATCC 35089 / DSM 1224 / JCM 13029 / OCM 148 / SB) TaxID=406327 RepID=A6UNG5_METVS|nr:ATP-binding protein [Methanococcus vannielii]ABR54037.1 Magnesium chelatase [Methanococcus vannielii SB]
MTRKFIYPFGAIVGQEKAKKALTCCAVDPSIGGVLLTGDKGAGKSTLVRSLSYILPNYEIVLECPFNCNPRNSLEMCDNCYKGLAETKFEVIDKAMKVVDLPLSITVDRLIGTIDIKKALNEGKRVLQPGILADANRNILYIDEVNLLDDYVIDILLDSAAMGWNTIEREGMSFKHPSRFVLVGSMNPEEGELRPQLLDRFGLYVEIESLFKAEDRLEVLKRVEEFQNDPVLFYEKYSKIEKNLTYSITTAKRILKDVKVPEELLKLLIDSIIHLGIKTHRAEITTIKTAKAIAALDGRLEVVLEDLKTAMDLALAHRVSNRGGNPPSESMKNEESEEIDEESKKKRNQIHKRHHH